MIDGILHKVAVIERDLEMATLYKNIISQLEDFETYGIFSNVNDSWKAIRKEDDLAVLFSIEFPMDHHLDEIAKLSAVSEGIRIIVLVGFLDTLWIDRAIISGAASFILRNKRLTDIEKALKAIRVNNAFFSPEIVQHLVESNKKTIDSHLTTREMEVLRLMADGKTYSMIAADLNISNHTSRAHIKNIYAKLMVRTKSDAIQKAFEQNLI